MIPFIIYKDTMFLRKIDGGFEFAEDYTGKIRTDQQLPDLDVIKAALKRTDPPVKGKRDRFVLIDWGDRLEALPSWGVPSGNLYNQEVSKETVDLVLSQDNVQAVIFVDDEGNVTYEESEA